MSDTALFTPYIFMPCNYKTLTNEYDFNQNESNYLIYIASVIQKIVLIPLLGPGLISIPPMIKRTLIRATDKMVVEKDAPIQKRKLPMFSALSLSIPICLQQNEPTLIRYCCSEIILRYFIQIRFPSHLIHI